MKDPFFWKKNIHPDDLDGVIAEANVMKSGKKKQKYRLLFNDGRIAYLLVKILH